MKMPGVFRTAIDIKSNHQDKKFQILKPDGTFDVKGEI